MVMRAMRRKQLSPKYEGLGGIKEMRNKLNGTWSTLITCTDYEIELGPIKLVEHNFPPFTK
jgi:hypothetical protein